MTGGAAACGVVGITFEGKFYGSDSTSDQEIILSKSEHVRIPGNRYFADERIRDSSSPALRSGSSE